jgi:hypothetical protein
MMKAFHCDDEFWTCPECQYEYVVNPDGSITSNVKDGTIIIAYKAWPTDKEGFLLIPDHEDFKEAILHYVLYRYYVVKAVTHEEAARQERDWHLRRYNTLAQKAKSLNLPDIDTLENIKNAQSRLVPRSNRYDNFFGNLGYKENLSY